MKISVNKIMKSMFLLLFLFLAIAYRNCPAQAAAKAKASKPKLTRTKLTLTVKRSKRLTVKNPGKKVKWSVSGKKLVSIKARGKKKQKAVITAGKKTGSCYVVAKVGKKKLRCRVIVKKKAKKTVIKDPEIITPVKEETDGFKEKKLSSQSENETNEYVAKKITLRQTDDTFIKAMSNTSVRLLQETLNQKNNSGQGKGNILISPDSILTAVSMVENGAAGDTLSEMEAALGGIPVKNYSQYLATLHSRVTGSKYLTYQMANSIWYKKGAITLKKTFLQNLVSYYGADVYAAPFHAGTVKDINSWVYNHTKGKIPSILNRLDPSARMAALNAIYFKGSWAEPYSGTTQRTFTKENGETQKVSMLEGAEHTYVNVKGAGGFVKNYLGGKVAFLALLPPKGSSVSEFVQGLSGTDLINAYKNRQTSNVVVYTRMPEFKYDYTVSLGDPLSSMGIRKAFSENADFSGMTNSPVCVDEILHKTHIDLNKNGTEAAAVTAVVVKAGAALNPEKITEKKVYLDRPFVYAIIDTETGLPLFLGVVNTI